jgi:hypothetical protein
VVSKLKQTIGGDEFNAWSLVVSKQMRIGGGEFNTAAALGMNEEDSRSFGVEAIHPSSHSSNPTMSTCIESCKDCRCKLLTSPSVLHACW